MDQRCVAAPGFGMRPSKGAFPCWRRSRGPIGDDSKGVFPLCVSCHSLGLGDLAGDCPREHFQDFGFRERGLRDDW
jgi:hypothetical protein